MAISVVGVAGSMAVPEWQQLMDAVAPAKVVSGLGVTVATGTRVVTVAAGVGYRAGALGTVSAPDTKTLAANSSGVSRIDVVSLRIDGTGTTSTAGTLVVTTGVPAASPIPPTLTSTPGGVVHIPLAYVTVVNGAGQLVSGNILDARPGIETPVALALTSGWSTASLITPLTVKRRAGVVFFGGRLTRTAGDFSDTATFGDGVFIPEGFRPTSTQNVWVGSDQADASTPTDGHLLVKPDGTLAMHIFHGSVATGQTLRVTDTSWIGA